MFSISFRKHRDEKKENNLLTMIIKMKILFARAITTSTARASSCLHRDIQTRFLTNQLSYFLTTVS